MGNHGRWNIGFFFKLLIQQQKIHQFELLHTKRRAIATLWGPAFFNFSDFLDIYW